MRLNILDVIEDGARTERAVRALEKAKSIEERELRSGYRYFSINNHTQVLIECNEKGEPTAKGLRQLNRYKQL